MISARCVARDLHTISPGPLERTCWRQFAALWGDCKKSRIAPLNAMLLLLYYISIHFYSKLCPSLAGSNPLPESARFLCPLLSLTPLLQFAPTRSSPQLRFGLLTHPPPPPPRPSPCYLLFCASVRPYTVFQSKGTLQRETSLVTKQHYRLLICRSVFVCCLFACSVALFIAF